VIQSFVVVSPVKGHNLEETCQALPKRKDFHSEPLDNGRNQGFTAVSTKAETATHV
jgi:hypothetical protein